MNQASIKLPANMRSLAGDKSEHTVEAATAAAALDLVCVEYPELRDRLLTPEGELQSFVNIFLNGKNLRDLNGLKTELTHGAELLVVAALAGG